MFSVSKSGLLSVYFNGIAKENDTTKTYCDSKNTVYKLFLSMCSYIIFHAIYMMSLLLGIEL